MNTCKTFAVKQFNVDVEVSLCQIKEMLAEKTLDSNLIFINPNFKLIATSIEKLYKSDLTLINTNNTVKHVKQVL